MTVKNHKTKPQISDNKKPIICPPEMAGKSRAFRIVGFICRMLVIYAVVFALTIFVCDAFNMGETAVNLQVTSTRFSMENQAVTSKIALWTGVFVLAFSLIWSGKFKTVAGVGVFGVSAALGFILKAPLFGYLLNSGKTFICDVLKRLSDSDYQKSVVDSLYNKVHGSLDAGEFTESELRTGGVLLFAFLLAAIFVPFLIKRVKAVVPAIVSVLLLAPIFTMNISRGTLGVSLVIASLSAVLVMAGYDGIFMPGKKADRYDAKISMFEDVKAAEPDEKQKKKAWNSGKAAKTGMGGIAGAVTLVVAGLIVLIPMLTVKNSLKIPWFSEKFDYVREYITALLQGDEATLDRLDYESSNDIYEAHKTDATDRIYNNTQIMYVEARSSSSPIYLRGWVGTEYIDGSWRLAVQSEDGETSTAVEKFQSIYGLEQYPDELNKLNFYTLMYPDEVSDILETENFSEKTRTKNNLGFTALMVGMRRINLRSSNAYLPAYYDVNKGLLEYGSMTQSDGRFINYFDGIFSGRSFSKKVAEGDYVKYSTVTFDPVMKNSTWTETVPAGIAEYNLQLAAMNVEKYGGSNLSAIITADNASKQMEVKYYVNYSSKTKTGDVQWTTVHTSGTELNGGVSSALNLKVAENLSNPENTVYTVTITTEYGDMVLTCSSVNKTSDGAMMSDGNVSTVTYELKGIYGVKLTKENSLFETKKEDADFIAAMNSVRTYANFVYDTYTKTVDSEVISKHAVKAADFAGVDVSVASAKTSTKAETYSERDKLVRGVIDYIIDSENGLGCEYRGVYIQTGDGEISQADCEKYLLRNQDKANSELDPIENFLENTKEGYCVQFASAAALILREYGIPVRYCEGYIVSRFNALRGNDSFGTVYSYVHDYEEHAWIEVYYDGIGWIQYETTPEYYTTAYGAKTEAGSSGTAVVTPDNPKIDDIIKDIEAETSPDEETEEETTVNEEYTHEDGTPMSKEEIAAEELRRAEEAARRELIKKSLIGLAVISGLVAVFVVIKVFADKAKHAEDERRRVAETVLGESFGQNSGENDLHEAAQSLIGSINDILKIFGLEPDVGEFRDEYAKRLSLELEDILGHASEYDGENPPGAEEPAPEDGNKKPKKPVVISNIRISEALENIAAEEFGNGMTVAQMKPVAQFYLELRGGLSKRVGLLRRFALRFFQHRI